jgi:hypothetical protein
MKYRLRMLDWRRRELANMVCRCAADAAAQDRYSSERLETMAQRSVVQLTDDLDGKLMPDGKGETIRFSLDRQDYEVDLAEKNAKALRDAF